MRAIEYLVELEDKQTGIEYFETIMRYIFSARTNMPKEDIEEIIDKMENTFSEGNEVIMTLAEKFVLFMSFISIVRTL